MSGNTFKLENEYLGLICNQTLEVRLRFHNPDPLFPMHQQVCFMLSSCAPVPTSLFDPIKLYPCTNRSILSYQVNLCSWTHNDHSKGGNSGIYDLASRLTPANFHINEYVSADDSAVLVGTAPELP